MAIYKSNSPKYEASSLSKKIGIVTLIICSICFVALFTNIIPFLKSFLMGVFGLFSYPLFITLFIVGVALINNKKYVMTAKYVLYLCLCLISLLAIIQLILVDNTDLSFFEYLTKSYTKKITAGGILAGIVVAPFLYILNNVACYIIFSLLLIVGIALVVDYLYYAKDQKKIKQPVKIEKKKKSSLISLNPIQENKEKKKDINIVLDAYLNKENKELDASRKLGIVETNIELDEVAKPKSRKEYLLTPPELDLTNYFNHNKKEIKQNIDILKSNDEPKVVVSNVEPKQKPNKVFHEEDILASPINRSSEKSYIAPVVENTAVNDNPKPQPVIEEKPEKVADKILKSLMQEEETATPTNISFDVKPMSFENDRRNIRQIKMEDDLKPIQYKKPSLDLITTPSVDLSTLNEDVATKSSQLEETLEQFNIPAKVIGASIGPAVTRYELEMPPGVSVKKILGHSEDIAYVLASNGDIRIEAPIPGMSAVGVEVPNNKIATVSLKEVLSSPEFLQNKNPLLVALGKDISGKIITCNLEKMPHLLVAGSTNSGKSVCLNTVIISLLYRLSPDEVKLVLIDPKRVEFSLFNGIPHLLTPHVINDSSKAVNALNYAVDEMERRYLTFETTKTRNIQEYNQLPDIVNKSKPKMSYIVVIIDELADLMMVTKKEVEEKIARLAQKARAAGIHLILATQRPSVDVITGTIKNNFPSRISFSLMSFADSKTVLDMGGAEKLLGKGDMLYKPSDVSEPKRVQGCFVSTKEIDDIVTYVKDNNKDYVFDKDIEDFIMGNNNHSSTQGGIEGQRSGLDPLLPEVLKMIIEEGTASVSMIQRRFPVGYPKAGKIIDQLEQLKYISKPDGSNKPRTVLITMEEYNKIFGKEE